MVSRFKWIARKRGNYYYASCCMYMGRLSGRQQYAEMPMHRYLLHPPKEKTIDHRNLNGLDNRRQNLRVCSITENVRNSRKQKSVVRNFTSKFKGLSWKAKLGKWLVAITVKGKSIYQGLYKSEIDAAIAYDKAAIRYFGEYAQTNFSRSAYV